MELRQPWRPPDPSTGVPPMSCSIILFSLSLPEMLQLRISSKPASDKKCHLLSVELTCAYRNDLHHMKESARLHPTPSKTFFNLPLSSFSTIQICTMYVAIAKSISNHWSKSEEIYVSIDLWNHPSNNDKRSVNWTIEKEDPGVMQPGVTLVSKGWERWS